MMTKHDTQHWPHRGPARPLPHDVPASRSSAAPWERFARDQLTLDELIALQRTLRPVIEAKRKRAGELRKFVALHLKKRGHSDDGAEQNDE